MQTDYLENWNVLEEQRKADFMEHMYKCSGRTNGLYTGLWQDFCLREAGPAMRERYFEMVKAVEMYQQGLLQEVNPAEAMQTA